MSERDAAIARMLGQDTGPLIDKTAEAILAKFLPAHDAEKDQRIRELELELHCERTGECPSCQGTGVIDAAEHRCGACNGRGYFATAAESALRTEAALHARVRAERDSLREQLAARDAVIARLKALPQTDWGMGNAGLDAHSVYAILAAAPESVLAEVKARALEEFAEKLRGRYPADVFPRPSEDDYDRLNKALARSNITLDRFSADLMRMAAAQADREAAEYRNGADHE